MFNFLYNQFCSSLWHSNTLSVLLNHPNVSEEKQRFRYGSRSFYRCNLVGMVQIHCNIDDIAYITNIVNIPAIKWSILQMFLPYQSIKVPGYSSWINILIACYFMNLFDYCWRCRIDDKSQINGFYWIYCLFEIVSGEWSKTKCMSTLNMHKTQILFVPVLSISNRFY